MKGSVAVEFDLRSARTGGPAESPRFECEGWARHSRRIRHNRSASKAGISAGELVQTWKGLLLEESSKS